VILLPRLPRFPALLVPVLLPVALAACGNLHLFKPSVESEAEKVDASTVPVETLYNSGVDALEARRYKLAVIWFNDVQQYYPYSTWATNGLLMEGYTEYLQHHYTSAIDLLDRFIQLHPANKNIAYAYYMRALCYYEQIEDTERDQKGTQEALGALQEVTTRFPDSAYGRDAKLKIDLCRDHLAGKEMEIGRYYERQHLYAAAINRFQRVVDNYQTTNHVPEALHRLTEIYLRLGMTTEAKRTAAVLGHNYPGSRWYEDSWNQLVDDHAINGKPVGQADNGGGFFSRTLGWIF
jgi:outer membrane protein assembly factor BamD